MKQIEKWAPKEKRDLVNFILSLNIQYPIVDITMCGSCAYADINFIRPTSDIDIRIWVNTGKPPTRIGSFESIKTVENTWFEYHNTTMDIRLLHEQRYQEGNLLFPSITNWEPLEFRWWELPVYSLTKDKYLLHGKDYLELRRTWGKPL